MRFEELRKEHTVFSYHTSPNYGIEGDDGGFSIQLYGNGNLRYCTYRLFDQMNSLEMFKLTREQVEQIFYIIQENQKRLAEVPSCLDNGREHKHSNELEFIGHDKIWAWDMKKTFLPVEMLKKPSYYREYKENMKWENTVRDVFDKICACMKNFGIELTQDSCELNDECRIRVTWQ